jgi:cyclic pyranopterin phosphate synthase
MLYTCLFATAGYDLRQYLRSNEPNQDSTQIDVKISNLVASIWQNRQDRYSELRGSAMIAKDVTSQKIEMSYIGG